MKNLLVAVSFEKSGNLRHQRIIRIWVTEQGADREQNLRSIRVNAFEIFVF